jgi:hypothetical protein
MKFRQFSLLIHLPFTSAFLFSQKLIPFARRPFSTVLRSKNTRKMSSNQQQQQQRDLVMDDFCIRQFNNPGYTGTQVKYDIQEFENRINEFYRSGEYPLVDGYAPFW